MVSIQSNLKNFSVLNSIKNAFGFDNQNDYKIHINERGIIQLLIRKCPLCNAGISKNGYNLCQNKSLKSLGLKIKKGKVVCKNLACDFTLTISKQFIAKWSKAFLAFVKTIILSLGTQKMSPGGICKHLSDVYKISISAEYVRVLLKKLLRNIKHPEPKKLSSGVIVHDEQFLKAKGIEFKRISSLDANNSNIYYDELHDNRLEETIITICKAIKKKINNIYAAVMDGYVGAKNAYEEVFKGILIQFCLFHYAKNVRDAYKEEVGYGKGRSCLPIQHLIGFYRILNIFFNHDRELNQLIIIQNELKVHIDRINTSKLSMDKKEEFIDDYNKKYDKKAAKFLSRIKKIRRRKNGIKLELRTEEEAKAMLEKAKVFCVFPKKVQKQINRLEKNWMNFTHCMRDKNIPPTSNKIEQYYAVTLNWIEKKNLQSKPEFYQKQKISLLKRYNIPLFETGFFSEFMQVSLGFMALFGIS